MIAVESIPGRKLGRVRIAAAETGPVGRSAEVRGSDHRGGFARQDRRWHQPSEALRHGVRAPSVRRVDSPEPAHVNLPGVHMIGSLLKCWLTGTLHYAVSQEQPRLLPGRVHLPLQPAHVQEPAIVVLSTAATGGYTDPHPLAELRNPVGAVGCRSP